MDLRTWNLSINKDFYRKHMFLLRSIFIFKWHLENVFKSVLATIFMCETIVYFLIKSRPSYMIYCIPLCFHIINASFFAILLLIKGIYKYTQFVNIKICLNNWLLFREVKTHFSARLYNLNVHQTKVSYLHEWYMIPSNCVFLDTLEF